MCGVVCVVWGVRGVLFGMCSVCGVFGVCGVCCLGGVVCQCVWGLLGAWVFLSVCRVCGYEWGHTLFACV